MTSMYSRCLKFLSILILAVPFAVGTSGCSQDSETPVTSTIQYQPIAGNSIDHAIDVQNRHTDELLMLPGIIGTAVGREGSSIVILILTSEHSVAGIPSAIEGIRTHIKHTGKIVARSVYTGVYRSPMWSGVSVGNDNEISSGTIGCVVKDRSNINYLLSCNHVFARTNAASAGEVIGQPGRFDVAGYSHAGQVATLSNFVPISMTSRARNVADAAIAKLTTSDFTSTAANNAYTPSEITRKAEIGMAVKKVGRTTGLTRDSIAGINATISVDYGSEGTARFINQIFISSNTFSSGGDSGSLIVTDDESNNPVGLLFAGTTGATFANPIASVLKQLGVTIVSTSWNGF